MSRKEFIRLLAFLVAIPYILLAGLMINRQKTLSRKEKIPVAAPVNEGITIIDEIIAVRQSESVEFFSARCSHLGCRLNSVDQGEIVCPCHGSRFSAEGISIRGPAVKPLKKLKFEFDEILQEYLVEK
jgi:Rieske Fe-S protein